MTTDLPFRHPVSLYLQGIHGDVTLRLFVDSLGLVVSESTRVQKPARDAAFDSAALEGAPRLRFRPARQGERRIGYTILFPIKFRVPWAPPPPEDTAGARR
jgi:TonB family protein